jgi:phosphotriesterase-related protein
MAVATYRGAVEGGDLGVTLMHEHVFVVDPELVLNHGWYAGWDEDTAVAAAVDRLDALADAGIGTLVDMTVLGLGRMPHLVARVAERTRLHIVGATGVYTLEGLPLYLRLRGPGAVFDEPDPMVAMFVRDLTVGMGETGVRAAVLKCVTDHAGMTGGVERAVRAVARAHAETGAPISTHSHARRRTGLDQQRVLAEEGVDLGRVVIGHAGDTDDLDYLLRLLDAGSYLGLDRFGLDWYLPTARRVEVVAELCRRGYAERLVLSHDSACHNDAFRAQDMARVAPDHHPGFLLDSVVPLLRAAGVADRDLDRMLVENPRRILAGE